MKRKTYTMDLATALDGIGEWHSFPREAVLIDYAVNDDEGVLVRRKTWPDGRVAHDASVLAEVENELDWSTEPIVHRDAWDSLGV